jgi:hypothetical protein
MLRAGGEGTAMDIATVVVGCAAIVYGLVTLVLRFRGSSLVAKVGPMQERFGRTAGMVIHVVAYSVLPLVFGVIALVLGLSGRSIFG